MASVDLDDEQATPQATSPNRRQSLIHLAVFTSLLIPIACIPYIPIRRHLLGLRKSVHVLSNNTLSMQHELNTTLLHARLLKEEKLQLLDQLRDLQHQLDAVGARAVKSESDRLTNDKLVVKRLDTITASTAQGEHTLSRVERELDTTKRRVERDRLPDGLLHDMSTSFADIASFIEEVEIQQGWSHSIPRDRGIDKMRQLALKLTVAKAKPNGDTGSTKS